MKLFAVILASIAALAATFQSYLLWDSRQKVVDSTLLLKKIEACTTVIQSLSAIERLAKDPVGDVDQMLEGQGGVTLILADDVADDSETTRRPELTEEMRRENAERGVLFGFVAYARELQIFSDAQIYHFSESERLKIDTEKLTSAVEHVGPYQFISGDSGISFEEHVARFRAATEQIPAIEEICLPIMSGVSG